MNFELTFETRYEDSTASVGAEPLRRIISAQDRYWATKIAQAMIGEEVQIDQYLSRVVEIIQTQRPSRLVSYSIANTWQRVIEKLGMPKYFYVEHNEQVGLQF